MSFCRGRKHFFCHVQQGWSYEVWKGGDCTFGYRLHCTPGLPKLIVHNPLQYVLFLCSCVQQSTTHAVCGNGPSAPQISCPPDKRKCSTAADSVMKCVKDPARGGQYQYIG